MNRQEIKEVEAEIRDLRTYEQTDSIKEAILTQVELLAYLVS